LVGKSLHFPPSRGSKQSIHAKRYAQLKANRLILQRLNRSSDIDSTRRGRKEQDLEDAVDRAHGALDVQGSDVLPVLLEERHQEVDGGLDVVVQLVLGHFDAADGDTHAQHLLHLELDGALDLSHLGLDVVTVSDQGGELASLVQSRTEETGDLTDDDLGSEEVVVLLG
jgi:hypothetical protein